MNDDLARRALEKVARLAAETEDVVSLWQASTEVLTRAVPHYWAPCWYTLDPASLLVTSHHNPEMETYPAEWLEREYFADDVHHLAAVARSTAGVTTIHEATGGDPSGSWRWQENMKLGGDQELLLAIRSRGGEVWGALGLYREPGRPHFDADEKTFLRAVAPHLAAGVRRALLLAEAREPEWDDSPGLLILDAKGHLESKTAPTDRWLDEFPDGAWRNGRLPSAVQATAARAAEHSERPASAEPAVARVAARSGGVLAVHASTLGNGPAARVAVIIEPAGPARVYPLLMAAYGFTPRERDVVELVLRGASTAEIATELHVTPDTVQQHLKSVFEKADVGSRRELTGRIFFAHFEPRLRDNEQRAAAGQPLRGGPAPIIPRGDHPARPPQT